MSKTIYIIDSFLLPTGYNHMFMAQKIARGFEYHGFRVRIVRRMSEIRSPGFVLICDHPVYFSLGARNNKSGNIFRIIPGAIQRLDNRIHVIGSLSTALRHKAYIELADQIKNKDIVVIGWNVHKDKYFLEGLKIPIIFTGEYYDKKPVLDYQISWYELYSDSMGKNCLPLKFAADVRPDEVGNGCKNDKYSVSYVGDKTYGIKYRSLFVNDPSCRIIPTPPYITEQEKIEVYKNSMIILGLTNKQSKMGGHVPERIFEALANGAICLTDSEPAVRQTEGCAVRFRSTRELRILVDKFKKDERKRLALRRKGFEYIKRQGTWASRALDFIKMADKLYNVKFD